MPTTMPGIDPGDQQLGNGGLGRDAVNDHGHAGRYQQVEGRPDAHGTGGQFLGIAVAPHFRIGDGRHDRGRRSARPGHGPEDPAGEDRCDPETAPYVRQPVGRSLEKVLGQAAGCGEIGHEDEHGDGGKGVIGDR